MDQASRYIESQRIPEITEYRISTGEVRPREDDKPVSSETTLPERKPMTTAVEYMKPEVKPEVNREPTIEEGRKMLADLAAPHAPNFSILRVAKPVVKLEAKPKPWFQVGDDSKSLGIGTKNNARAQSKRTRDAEPVKVNKAQAKRDADKAEAEITSNCLLRCTGWKG